MKGIYTSEQGARQLAARYTAALGAWPVDNEQLTVPTPEGDTFVVASGPADAPVLVLLHGSGSNSGQWVGAVAEYAARFRVLAVDVIGEPGRSAPARPPLGSDRYAAWLDAVLDHAGAATARIAGVSLGGWLAIDYATRRPGRVAALVLTCPGGLGRPRYGFLAEAAVLRCLGERGRRRALARVLGPVLDAVGPDGAAAIAEHQALVSKSYRYRPGTLPVFGDDTVRALTMPVRAVAGEQDVLMNSAITKRRLETLAADATVHVLPGVGHLVPPQTGDEVEFLTARLGAPRS